MSNAMPVQTPTAAPHIARGLAGVIADTSRISKVMPETNSLTYRGYPVQELAAQCCFEEVAYLIWHGELPNAAHLAGFMAQERALRHLPPHILQMIANAPNTAHPMDVVRSAVSLLAFDDSDASAIDSAGLLQKSQKLMAQIPTAVAADMRRRRGLAPIAPDSTLGFAENFLFMCFGSVPSPEIVKAFDTSLTLYAEHGFNASTFAARVIVSTLSDIYAGVTGAIGALKGSLHGGANEAVMEMMLEIDDPAKAADWLRAALNDKRKIMGFGHRVYRNGDSRVPTMTTALKAIAHATNGKKWLEMADILEATMLAEKNIHPNLDFPTGPAYYLMGFDINLFTPIFVMARITGWTAHIMEQLADNKLIRPLSHYEGVPQRAVQPMKERQ